MSLLPKKFYKEDRDLGNQHRLQDCQGRRLDVGGTRETEIEVVDTNEEMVTLRHRFLVGEVTSCLLSLRQLLKSGWTLNHDERQKNKLLLCSPDREAAITVGYHGMSLAIEGTEEDDEHQIPLHVRMMVQSREGYGIETEPNNLWRHCDEEMVFIKSLSKKLYDTKTTWGERLTFRSTFIQELNELPGPARRWQMVEFCEDISMKENMTENTPECGGSIWLVLTIASGDYFDFDKLFDIVDEDALNPMVGEAEKEARARRELGLHEGQQDEALASREKDECEPMEVSTEVVVNEMTSSPYSAMKDPRAAAKWLGVPTAGSRQKILDRLNYTIKREERRQAK